MTVVMVAANLQWRATAALTSRKPRSLCCTCRERAREREERERDREIEKDRERKKEKEKEREKERKREREIRGKRVNESDIHPMR